MVPSVGRTVYVGGPLVVAVLTDAVLNALATQVSIASHQSLGPTVREWVEAGRGVFAVVGVTSVEELGELEFMYVATRDSMQGGRGASAQSLLRALGSSGPVGVTQRGIRPPGRACWFGGCDVCLGFALGAEALKGGSDILEVRCVRGQG